MSTHHTNPLLFFALLLKASLLSTGGTGNLPSVRADFTVRGWASQSDVLQSLTIGQLSPGPTGLWVVAFGYLTGGLVGALLSITAIVVPPLAVLPIRRAYARLQGFAGVEGFVHGLGLAAIGAFGCVMIQLLLRSGANAPTIGIAVAACALATIRRLPSIAILAAAAVVGIVWR